MSFVSKVSGKIKSAGRNIAGKIKTFGRVHVGKALEIVSDVNKFIKETQKQQPLLTEIISDVAELVPGVSGLKKSTELGFAGLEQVRQLLKKGRTAGKRVQSIASKIGGLAEQQG